MDALRQELSRAGQEGSLVEQLRNEVERLQVEVEEGVSEREMLRREVE